jgi:hypothetical protein
MTLQAPAAPTADQPRTVVWIDSRMAILARWDGTETSVTRVRSDVPVHRRSTGHVTHNPSITHGGGMAPQRDGEARRLEHLARFLRAVVERLDPFDAVDVMGPGTVHERLALLIREEDDARHRERSLSVRSAAPMTQPQILARLRILAGVPAPRGRRPRTMAAPRRSRPLVAIAHDEEPG